MKRRNFIKKTAIGSACALAGTMIPETAKAKENEKKVAVKITVLKKSLNSEWNKELRGKEGKKCEVFQVGQEFVVKSPWSAPEGFCHWAWADIRTFIHLVREGKWDSFVSCCTDGFRPVFFKLEKIEIE